MIHKLIKTNVIGIFLFYTFLVGGFSAFAQEIPFLNDFDVWYNADSLTESIGELVNPIVDVQGNSNAAESNIDRQAEIDSLVGIGRVLVFDGSTRYSLTSNNVATYLAVVKLTDNSSNTILCNKNATANGVFFTSEVLRINFSGEGSGGATEINEDFESWILVCATGVLGQDNQVSINNVVSDLPDDAGFGSGTIRLGNPNSAFTGYLKDFAILNRHLDQEEMETLVTYFMNRYSEVVELGADLIKSDFCSETLLGPAKMESWTWSTGQEGGDLEVTKSGTYWIDALDVFGRMQSDTITITYPGTFLDSFSLCAESDSLWQTNLELFDVEWHDGTTTTNYEITEEGQYYLTVTDTEGCFFSSDTVDVVIDAFPLDVAISEPAVFCQGNALFLSEGADEAEAYLWNTGEETAFIEPPGSGQYWVEATNANGCVGTDTVDIVMAGVAPTVAFDVGVACATREVFFANTTEPDGGLIVASNWVFGPAPEDEVEGADVDYSFPVSGSYPVELTVLLDNGCTGTKWDTVQVSPLPLVDFNYNSVIPCAGNEVAFESQSGVPGGGSIAAWHWRFSNDTEDTGVVGSTTFEALGTASVLHIAESSAGCTDSLTVPVVVLGSPVVDFSFDTVCVGIATGFQEMVDVSQSGSVFYQWQFGDGFFSNFPNTSHMYDSPGSYEVTLKATGNDFGNPGCVDQATKTVRVFDAPSAEISLQDACVGEGAVLLDLTETTEIDGTDDPITSRLWSVALGPSITEEIGVDATQLFFPGEAGTYPILFDFVTHAGCVGSTDGLVEVLAIPTAAFTLDVPAAAPPVSVSVDNQSVDAIAYTWFVNGEVVSNGVSPELLLPDTGSYTIGLVAENELGCSDLVETSVVVIVPEYDLALLDVQFEFVGSSTPIGDRLQLTALLSNYGNTVITEFDMEVQIGKDINFTQQVEGVSIAPGEVVFYPLEPDFEFFPQRTLPYSCMTVSNPNGIAEETDYDNNTICIGLDEERVTFIAPYPNPVSDLLHLGFVLPKSGLMEIDIVNAAGVEVYSSDYNLKEGYSVIDYSVEGLADGLYFLRYVFGGEEHVERIVVAKGGN